MKILLENKMIVLKNLNIIFNKQKKITTHHLSKDNLLFIIL